MDPVHEHRLRTVLRANAATSASAGLVTLAAAHRMSRWFGLDDPTVLRVLGATLILFGAEIAWWLRRAPHRLTTIALATSAADLAWMAGTVAVLATIDLTTAGVVVAAAVGVLVLDFAAAQLWLRRRLQPSEPTTTHTPGAVHV